MAQQYRVAHLFAHEGRTYTNAPADLKAIKKLPRKVRDTHIARGNLIEWDDSERDTPPSVQNVNVSSEEG